MTGHTNNISSTMTSSSMMNGLTAEQVNTFLLFNPNIANFVRGFLPSSLHAAGAAAAVGEPLQPAVLASGPLLTAPPSIDNSGGAEDSNVETRRDEALGGATVGFPASAAAPAVSSQRLQPLQQSGDIVIVEERPAYVARSSPVLSRPVVTSFRSNSSAAAAVPTVPQHSSAAATAGAAAEGAVGTAVSEAQTMLLGSITGLPLNVQVTAGGPILLNDFGLPATPESPQNTSFSTATSSGVSSGASSTAARSAVAKMQTLKDALAANGRMTPKRELLSRDGSELDINGRPPIPLCAICSADSTGIHFGVEACAACSAFFRRTVVLKKDYICNKGGGCVTHKDTAGSTRCRACRFTKCLSVGMDTNAVQHRRDAIGKMSQVKKEGSPDWDEEGTATMSASYHNQMAPSTSQKSVLDEWMGCHMELSKNRKLFYELDSLTAAFDHSIHKLYPNPWEMKNFSECIFQLWRIEPRLVAKYVNENSQTTWLPPHEKAALFRNFFLSFQAVEEPYLTWHHGGLGKEWWVMPNRMYFSFEHINDYFASNVMQGLNLDMATAVRIFIPSFRHAMSQVATQMDEMAITQLEMVALSGIVYLDPMASGISKDTREYLFTARGQLIGSLMRYYQDDLFANKDHQINDDPLVRIDKLLAISAGVKIHSQRTRENMQILSMFEVIPCDNLFNEICNIQSAYNDETRDRLRSRALEEKLVTEDKIKAMDRKWADFKDQKNAGMVKVISDMQGYKTQMMTAPVIDRNNKDQSKQQLAMMMAQEIVQQMEQERNSSSEAVAVPPVAAPVVVSQQPFVTTFTRPQTVVSLAAPTVAAATASVAGNRRNMHTLPVTPRVPFYGNPSSAMNIDAAVERIIANQPRADMLHKQLESQSHNPRPIIYPGMRPNDMINAAGVMTAVDTNLAQQREKQNADALSAMRAAQQEAPGPSSEKRARMSVIDSGTNPVTPPSNSGILAALQANAASQLQQTQPLQQLQPNPAVMVPVSMAGLGLSNLLQNPLVMTPQIQQLLMQQQVHQQQQHLNQLLQMQQIQQLLQPAVTLASLQQQQHQPPNGQNPF